MNVEIVGKLRGTRLEAWERLLHDANLTCGEPIERTALVWDGDELVATASRFENIFKYIATKQSRQGEDLTATAISALRTDAFEDGHKHLFLYTKPKNEMIFSSLFFYPIASTDKVLLMENRQNGICDFVASLGVKQHTGRIGSLVMNCNPFTLGHQSLIETASSECDHVYVFVLSEDKSYFSANDRIEMVKLGTAHLENVTVLPTGPYLISSATFPTYFIKERDAATEIQCALDIEIFARYFVPVFSINARYVGAEPLSPLTQKYNDALAAALPKRGIELVEIERTKAAGKIISASLVREYINLNKIDMLNDLLPKTTLDYLHSNNLI